MKSKKLGIIKVELKYLIPEGENPVEYLENVELPENYKEDSFEIKNIVNIKKQFVAKVYSKDKRPNGAIWTLWGVYDTEKDRFIDDYDHSYWYNYNKEKAEKLAEDLNIIETELNI